MFIVPNQSKLPTKNITSFKTNSKCEKVEKSPQRSIRHRDKNIESKQSKKLSKSSNNSKNTKFGQEKKSSRLSIDLGSNSNLKNVKSINYTCDFCDYKTDKYLTLKKHLKKHTKDFSCSLCQFRTSILQNMRNHMTTMHPSSVNKFT